MSGPVKNSMTSKTSRGTTRASGYPYDACPRHQSVGMVLKCANCARKFWEHVSRVEKLDVPRAQ